MKKLLPFLLLTTMLGACSRDSNEQTFEPEEKTARLEIMPGELTQIERNLWIQAEEVSYPELRNVVLYSREDSGELRTFHATEATIQEGKEEIIQITLYEATFSIAESPENQETILMDSYSFEIWKEPGWSYPSSSPFDKQGPEKFENKAFQYKVANGDDVQSISKMFIVTEADLLRWNPELKLSDHLDVGQLIWIKGDND